MGKYCDYWWLIQQFVYQDFYVCIVDQVVVFFVVVVFLQGSNCGIEEMLDEMLDIILESRK